MKFMNVTVLAIVVFFTGGCATGLNSMQEREYQAMKADNVLVEEKNPTTGALLGLLPGFGSFYVREPGYGIVNLLFWPASILWDPVSGYQGSMAINYDLTKYKLKKDMEEAISELDNKRITGNLSDADYIIAKKKIEQKYDYD